MTQPSPEIAAAILAVEPRELDLFGESNEDGVTLTPAEWQRVRATVLEREQYAKNGWGQIIHESWGCGDFYGPCAHGRDPYTRCDECESLTPREALLKTERARLRAAVLALAGDSYVVGVSAVLALFEVTE